MGRGKGWASASVRFPGASTNRNSLTLAFLGLFVEEGVFDSCRARCELEEHARDIYDAFHAVHARAVQRTSYYTLEELRGTVSAAHAASADEQTARPFLLH